MAHLLITGGHLHRADFGKAYESTKLGLTGKSASSAIMRMQNLLNQWGGPGAALE